MGSEFGTPVLVSDCIPRDQRLPSGYTFQRAGGAVRPAPLRRKEGGSPVGGGTEPRKSEKNKSCLTGDAVTISRTRSNTEKGDIRLRVSEFRSQPRTSVVKSSQ